LGADQLLDRQLQLFQFGFQNIALIQQRRIPGAQLLITGLQNIKVILFGTKDRSGFIQPGGALFLCLILRHLRILQNISLGRQIFVCQQATCGRGTA
jgi:hypothetical protein